ncbi:MAG: CoA activase, partial [Deltaproteobacteria bacterium]|nr:CoA activase [Deltaproteobacteria bacterium]
RGRPRIALTDQFHINGLFPFFATFLFELGLDPVVHSGGGHRELKRGIEEANVPFCAPMQLYQGVVSTMAEAGDERLFLPMIRSLTPAGDEERAVLCPVVQGSADITGANLGEQAGRVWSPVVDFGREGMGSREFVASCQRIAADLGVEGEEWMAAFEEAHRVQRAFEDRCLDIGRRALSFCEEKGITPVVVLGRAYTIHNDVLNSNVPSILREQGVMPIPVDCYPVADDVPVFQDIYWAFVQRSLRAAHQIRRTPGIYSIWCSNYACGPDSFGLHFYTYIMEGRPFAIIETDGHAGDAGTKTRVEAFLFCVREDLRQANRQRANRFTDMTQPKATMADIRRRGETFLVPRMGPGAEGAAATLRGLGLKAECLPMPDREAVRMGRRHTSGKECVPMCITLGSLLQRLEGERESDDRFVFFMPTTCGPCRFGVYHLLHKIVLKRLDLQDRVRIFSPQDKDYFDGVPPGAEGLLYSGAVAHDVLSQAYYDARPTEARPGVAEEIYHRNAAELNAVLERVRSPSKLSVPALLWEVASGRLFGLADLLARSARELASVKTDRPVPTVFVAGEIYVRMDPFANDFVLDRLTRRGIRARMAPLHEWLEYCDWFWLKVGGRKGIGPRLKQAAKTRIADVLYSAAAGPLGWPERPRIEEAIFAAGPYVREELEGEAVLTVGGPVHEWQNGHIDGLVSVGPLECMPNKVAEAQLFHVHEREGLLSLTLPLNGDPVDPELLDNFAYEVHARFRAARR